MLEHEGILWTWALPALPRAWLHRLQEGTTKQSTTDENTEVANDPIVVERLPDHRMAYLDYEGPLSGGRGSVSRCLAGEYRSDKCTTDEIVVHLEGPLLGTLYLEVLTDNNAKWAMSWQGLKSPS
jgi:hypothetical protein